MSLDSPETNTLLYGDSNYYEDLMSQADVRADVYKSMVTKVKNTKLVDDFKTTKHTNTIAMAENMANIVKNRADDVLTEIHNHASTRRLNMLEGEVKKALDIEVAHVMEATLDVPEVIKAVNEILYDEYDARVRVLQAVMAVIKAIPGVVNTKEEMAKKDTVRTLAEALKQITRQSEEDDGIDEIQGPAPEETPIYAIGDPVYVERTGGGESIAFVKNYDPNHKIYKLELRYRGSREYKDATANHIRSVSHEERDAILKADKAIKEYEEDKRREEERQRRARKRSGVEMGESLASIIAKNRQKRFNERSTKRVTLTGGRRNTKKYRRRNKRKTKHYKKKTKRYTKKRNMRY